MEKNVRKRTTLLKDNIFPLSISAVKPFFPEQNILGITAIS